MKLSPMGRATLASVLSLAVALGLTACTRDYTVAFLYSLSPQNTEGQVNVFHVDFQSGALLQLPNSPVDSNGQQPSALVASADQLNLYVTNQNSNNVVWFKIGTDGTIYAQSTYNTHGAQPLAIAISPDSAYLYVLCLFGNGATTGPGEIDIFPISSDVNNRQLGTPVPVQVGLSPKSLWASGDSKYVYVIDQDPSTAFNLLGFSRGTGGALTPLAGTTINPGVNATGYQSGIQPSAIVEDQLARYIYVTDSQANQVIGYTNMAGVPTAITNGPFPTGSFPDAITIDPRGKFVYIANYNDSTVTPYVISPATGSLSTVSGSSSAGVATGPTCITVEDALGVYLYTSNHLDGSISGLQLNSTTGALKNVQNTPFSTSSLPTCAVAVANGSHATQIQQ